jgi:hypothetical protein
LNQDPQCFEHYLRDLGFLLKEMALAAHARSKLADATDYDVGYLMAFHRVISLMQQQTIGFQLSLKQICLDDIDADVDLV